MAGLGTLANVLAIVLGGLIGVLFGKKIPERFQETIQTGNAVAVLFIGIGGNSRAYAESGGRDIFDNRNDDDDLLHGNRKCARRTV